MNEQREREICMSLRSEVEGARVRGGMGVDPLYKKFRSALCMQAELVRRQGTTGIGGCRF
jgi:hypothetical protein